ncbi:MAG: pyocin knob domain-containing protein [Muribaculum sp.]|nr:pyocin knob domain-containing protein [Muribaculum sp.]
MAEMEKAFELIKFRNKRRPALNETNMNKISTAVNTIDDRVIELNNEVEQNHNEAVVEVLYAAADSRLCIRHGDGTVKEFAHIGDVTKEELDERINRRIIAGAEISGNGTSSELEAMEISNGLTVLEVFGKLPDWTTAFITSNSQQTVYSGSFPANEGAAQLIYNKAYADRGTVLFLPIHGSRVWLGKLNNGAISWEELFTSDGGVITGGESADGRTLALDNGGIAFHLPANGFAGGLNYFKAGGLLACIGYTTASGGYYYMGEAYNKPNGKVKVGSLEAQGTVKAAAFDGNASSASQASAAGMLAGWEDTRSAATKPNDYNAKLLPVGIKQRTATGIPGGGTYAALVGIRGWTDSSGGKAHELAFDGSGKLFHRVGDTDTWEAWQELAHVSDIPQSDGTASAAKLATARTIQINLASQNPEAFDGTKDVTPGVTGVLPLKNGGTGAANAAAARAALGITAANIGAAVDGLAESGDFNNITAPGVYTMRGSGTKNQPASGNYWGLIVLNSDAEEYYVEQIAVKEGTTEVYVRYCAGEGDDGGEWSSWVRLARMTDTVAAATTAGTATKAVQDGNGNNIAGTYAKKTDITMEWAGHQMYDAADAAQTVTFAGMGSSCNYILLCEGGLSKSGYCDYGRVILLTGNGSNSDDCWITTNLATYYSGSTARFSVDKTATNVTIKVNKGAFIDAALYRLKHQ